MNNLNAISIKEAKTKAASYCAYRERTQQEVRNKLYEYGLFGDEVEELIASLITEGFINEERFAKAYAGGKFRMNNWGRVKIQRSLESKGISDYCIAIGLREIDEDDYLEKVRCLIEKKVDGRSIKGDYVEKNKVANFLIGKGFEPTMVWDVLKSEDWMI